MTTKNNAKIIAWDIETTDLSADWGWVLSAAWADLNRENNPSREVQVVRIDSYKGFNSDRTNDKPLLVDFANALGDADVFVTWYGDRFDIPFVNTRLLGHGLSTLPTVPSVDGWRAARNHLKLTSNRLANVEEFFGSHDKTPVLKRNWQRARAGHTDGLDYVVDHNIKDIVALGNIYDLLRPIIRNHPNINLVERARNEKVTGVQCPVCSSNRVHSRGYRIAKSRRSVRYQCQACGGWFQGKSEPVPAIAVGSGVRQAIKGSKK